MSEKPEALRLADNERIGYRIGWQRKAAAELRRLHADNERLTADNERLREELRQSSIDHTRAEVERLKAERDEAVRAEREACAKVCEDDVRTWSHPGSITRAECAAAIRARGQEPPR